MGKWIVAVVLAGMIGGFGVARAADADVEYLLLVEPGVAGVSVISVDKASGQKTRIVNGAVSVDEAIRQAMLRTGKPLMLKFGS